MTTLNGINRRIEHLEARTGGADCPDICVATTVEELVNILVNYPNCDEMVVIVTPSSFKGVVPSRYHKWKRETGLANETDDAIIATLFDTWEAERNQTRQISAGNDSAK